MGDLHIIRNKHPEYVVLTEAHYQELIAEAEEAYVARVKASFEDVMAGRVKRCSAAEFIKVMITDKEIILLDIGSHNEVCQ